jgi:hypothetical protein
MRIGIIGVGNIGGTLARLWVRAGHDVTVSNSRGPDTLGNLVDQLGDRAHAGTVEEAAAFGDVVRDGQYAELDDDRSTSSELLARHLEGARVVKAFNSIFWEHLRDLGRPAGERGRIGLPVSGDDPEAKRVVAGLINEIGFDAVDAGSLALGGRKHQPGTTAYTEDLPTESLQAALR